MPVMKPNGDNENRDRGDEQDAESSRQGVAPAHEIARHHGVGGPRVRGGEHEPVAGAVDPAEVGETPA